MQEAMQPQGGCMQGEGPYRRAKGKSQLFLSFSWRTRKEKYCICMLSHQLYGSAAHDGCFSHIHISIAAMALVSQGMGTRRF